MKKINADTAVGLNALFVCLVTAALPTITSEYALCCEQYATNQMKS